MAFGDISVLSDSAGVIRCKTDARNNSSHNATLKAGEVVKRVTNTDQFAGLALTGDGEAGTDILLGVVHEESNETATAEGHVDVDFFKPGTRIRGRATTVGNIDTQAELDDVLMDFVSFDGPAAASTSSFNYTIDEDEGDDPNVHCLFLVDGDIGKGTLEALVVSATVFGSTV